MDRSPTPRPRWGFIVALAAVVVLVAGACTSRPTRDAGPEEPAPPTLPPGPSLAVDWNDPTSEVVLDNGWVVRHCEGEAPVWCVDSDPSGDFAAVAFEVVQFPASAVDELRTDRSAAALERWAAALLDSLGTDRLVACGAGYRFERAPTERFAIGGRPGIRYGFRGFTEAGVVSEATVGHATVHGDTLTLLLSSAYSPAGCLPPEGPELTIDQLDTLLPSLTRIAADSPPPPPR